MIPFGKLQYAGGPIYTMALLGFKVSLLTAYIRIGGFVQSYRNVLIGAIVACVANQLIFTFILLFACRPVSLLVCILSVAKTNSRGRSRNSGIRHCRDIASIPSSRIMVCRLPACLSPLCMWYVDVDVRTNNDAAGLAGTSIGYDILILSLPIPVLLKLQLRRRQKIALVVIFALGFFVTIIQIIRIFTVKNLKTYTDSKPIIIWSLIEVSIAVSSFPLPLPLPLPLRLARS